MTTFFLLGIKWNRRQVLLWVISLHWWLPSLEFMQTKTSPSKPFINVKERTTRLATFKLLYKCCMDELYEAWGMKVDVLRILELICLHEGHNLTFLRANQMMNKSCVLAQYFPMHSKCVSSYFIIVFLQLTLHCQSIYNEKFKCCLSVEAC